MFYLYFIKTNSSHAYHISSFCQYFMKSIRVFKPNLNLSNLLRAVFKLEIKDLVEFELEIKFKLFNRV